MIKKITKLKNKNKHDDELDKLRVELSMLMSEHDNLVFHQLKNIEDKYMLKFGKLEYEVMQLECQFRRIRAKLELIIAKRNHNQKIDLAEIDSILDDELEEFYKNLEKRLRDIEKAKMRLLIPKLSDEETKKIKSIYRKLIKRLHPDLNPNLNDFEKELFNRVVDCYEKGNLSELSIIDMMLKTEHETEIIDKDKEKQRLIDLIDQMNLKIKSIKSDYPYTLKAVLVSEEKTKQRYNELHRAYDEYSEQIEIYKAEIAKYI